MNQPIIFSAKGISANTPGTLRVKPDGEVSAGTVGESVTNCFIAKFKKYVDPVLKDASMKSMNPKSLNLTVGAFMHQKAIVYETDSPFGPKGFVQYSTTTLLCRTA